MSLWTLLKVYVQDVEEANSVKFSNEAWQRIKQLERDINTYHATIEEELRQEIRELVIVRNELKVEVEQLSNPNISNPPSQRVMPRTEW